MPPRPLAADTRPEAEQVQIELLRRASLSRRFGLVRSLSATTGRLAWRGLRLAHPQFQTVEIKRLFVALHYVEKLAAEVFPYLKQKEDSAMVSDDILAAIGPVVDLFEQLEITYLIGGSVASSVYGIARSTLDADLSADVRPEHIEALVAGLNERYYVSETAIREALERRSSFNLIHLDTMVKLVMVIFVLKDAPFDQATFQRMRPAILNEAEPRSFQLLSPEDIVLRKLDWYRAGGNASERQ